MSHSAAAATAANEQGRAWRHAWPPIACGVLIALIVAGCGHSKAVGPTATIGGVQLSSAELHTLFKQTSDYQRAILQDGFVSMDEYQQAALAFVQCARDVGVTFVTEPKQDAIGDYGFSFRFTSAGQKPAKDACYAKYFAQVQMAWAGYRAPHEDEILQNARDDLGNCLRAAGMDIPKHPNSADFKEYMTNPTAAFARCAQSVQQTDNLPGFVG